MANNVNPPPQNSIPIALLKDPIVADYFRGIQTQLFQLRRRTGGDDDFISSLEEGSTSTNSRVSRNAARINSIELKEFEIVSVTTNIETSGNQILDCTNTLSINVTLDTQAVEGDEVHIKRRGEEVIVLGSIDGVNDLNINVPLYSIHLIFNGSTWISI
jgi:hypothetical protein